MKAYKGLKIKDLKIPPKVKRALSFATKIVPTLPARNDTILQVIVKVLSIFDSIEELYAPAKRNPLNVMIERLGLEEMRNEQFVSLFFGTNLYEQFTIQKFSLTEYMDILQASHSSIGDLFFVQSTFGNSGPEPSFYHTKGIDFAEILKGMWDSYEGRMHVTVGPNAWGSGSKSEFATFSAIPNPMFGKTQDAFDHLVNRHRRFVLDKIPRSYMFYGPAGTGKSSFVIAFAEQLGHRTLKLDASSLSHIHVKDIAFLLTNLAPDFLIIDDVDKADPGKGLPTLLDILQRFKTEHPRVSLLMTANNTEGFDAGMLRPGRIDTWTSFELPSPEERHILFTRYLAEAKLEIESPVLEKLVEMTDGLSHDYVRGIAIELQYDEVEHVSKTIEHMTALLNKSVAARKPATGKATLDVSKPLLPV